jgi:hypothetical protein
MGDLGSVSSYPLLGIRFHFPAVSRPTSSMICRSYCTPHSCRDISSLVEQVSVMVAVVGDGGGGGSARSVMVRMSQWISVRSCMFALHDAWYAARRSSFMHLVASDC